MKKPFRLLTLVLLLVLNQVLIAYERVVTYLQTRSVRRIPDRILREGHYQNQPVLLLALYQQALLRPDLKRFVMTARELGFYVVAANNGVLTSSEIDLFDVYIERPNVGRDFGSYRSAFLYLFRNHLDMQCPRVLMMNDSVFFESTRAAPFLKTMRDTDKEVLAATENNEPDPHFGSFSIAIGNHVLKSPRFHTFWQNYRLSQVRPVVIQYGELGLSDCLKKCVSTETACAVYYNLFFLHEALIDPANIERALRLARVGHIPMWKSFVAKMLWDDFLLQKGIPPHHVPIEDPADLTQVVDAIAPHTSILVHHLQHEVRRYAVAALLEMARRGSQIHQSNAFLLYLGLPLIKLDGIYRGFFNSHDVENLCALMEPNEAAEFRALITRRSFWGETLMGPQKWFYYLGIR